MKLFNRLGSIANAHRRMKFAPVTFSEEAGVRYLHFGTEWIQGAMRLRKPDAIELEYAQQMMAWMLFRDAPEHIVQLGLGAAALTKFCYRTFPQARVTAVEVNPEVVRAAHSMFCLMADDDRLTVLEADAGAVVGDIARRATIDVIQIDLYDATARGPVIDSTEFYSACRRCLRGPSMITVNLFGDHPSFARNMRNLSDAFDGRVVALPEVHQGNRVALAFAGPALRAPLAALFERAAEIETQTRLPARRWLGGLQQEAGDFIEGGWFAI